jgi:16S rRNA (cytosine967-C5)-methyltransferase
MIAPARIAAYDILRAVSAGSADLPAAVAAARGELEDDRDQALAADIAAGVQRWRATLDHLIVEFARRSLDRLDAEVVEILRLSAYQLLHHTRVPASAVVDDAVDLTRRAGKRSAAGFVNAILRAISRSRNALPLPPRPHTLTDRTAALEYLSVALSHPRWLVARWFDRMGFDRTEAWLRFNNTPAPMTLRTNRLMLDTPELIGRLEAEGVKVGAGRFAPDALVVAEGHPLRGGAAREGWFLVQDEASQLVGLLASARPGARVLDACAAPGGKTAAIAAAMSNAGLLIACDVRQRRVALLRRTLATTGARNVRIVQSDLRQALPFSRPFDSVIVDVPCSGLGTLRRDPDIRWRRQEADLPAMAAAELLMLRHAAEAVAAGGRLIYATCSSEPEENDAVVNAFLAGSPGFVRLDARAAAPQLPAAVVDDHGFLRTEPHLHSLESFFGAVFERQDPGCL